ncbi:glutathione S-transferase family protein [Hahella sp. NBU794]|uniref:glutathione S-transferase family protein n=1 Tax=Hahella sp. NBU794 TaxID=3422590 RepID=UPI003D6F2585
MYTLYYVPGACSLATQVVLHELNQPVQIISKQAVENFQAINPVGTVPVLKKDGKTYTEGAAVMLHLLETHPNALFPTEKAARAQAIQNIMFANATMHPAYSKLFFVANTDLSESAKQSAYASAASSINQLWNVVEDRLTEQNFLGGETVSAADIMLTVYSRWGASFPVDIHIGPNTQKMIDHVLSMASFQTALNNEQRQAAA